MSIEGLFEKHHESEFLEFDRIQNKRTQRADLHAFMLLDELFPGNADIVSSAGHDEFYLGVAADSIKTLTEAQVVELLRCGVMYEEETESLYMFT